MNTSIEKLFDMVVDILMASIEERKMKDAAALFIHAALLSELSLYAAAEAEITIA